MLYLLLAVLISAGVSTAMILVTRQRLARQFEDIQRRLLNNERSLAAIKDLKEDLQNAAVQLQRVHLGLTRIQENVAHRFDDLAPRGRSVLSEFQFAMLEQWVASLGGAIDRAGIENLAHLVARAEGMELRDLPIGTMDLLAQILVLHNVRNLGMNVGLVGPSADLFERLLARITPVCFPLMKVEQGAVDPASPSLNVVIFDASISEAEIGRLLGAAREVVLLVLQAGPAAGDGSEREFPGFVLAAAEWNTRVYRRAEVA